MKRIVFCLALLAAVAIAGAAQADQKDARLPGLFDQLKAAPNSDAATEIEAKIWAIWVKSSDPEIDGLMAEGEREMGERHYPQALQAFNRMIEKRPHFGAISGMGLVDIKLERMEDAAKAYERYLAINPQNQDARDTLGMINAVLKRKSI